MWKIGKSTLSLALAASLAACTGENTPERESSSIDTVVSQSATVEVPGALYDGWLDLTIHDSASADGHLSLLDEGFALQYIHGSEDLFVIINERSGDSLTIRAGDSDAEFTFSVGGSSEVFPDSAALRSLNLQLLPEHTLLLLAAQVADDVDAAVQASTTEYAFWFLAIIVVAVVADICSGTEMTCNGAVMVRCPDGSSVRDPCGCGESTCNKCVPSTCADECVVSDPCPTPEPHEPHPTPIPTPK